MQMAGALFLKLFGGAAAAAGTAGAASSGLSLLSGIGTAFAAISQIGAGISRSNELKAQAAQQEFAAKDEYIAGKETSAALKLELAKTIGNQRVAFAAGGVDLGSVSVDVAKRQASSDAEKELAIGSNEALSRNLARRRAARNLRSQASGAITQGVFGALQTGVNGVIDYKERYG